MRIIENQNNKLKTVEVKEKLKTEHKDKISPYSIRLYMYTHQEVSTNVAW